MTDNKQSGLILVRQSRERIIKTFEDKCSLAAGRAKDRYPTTALTIVPLEEVIDVGVYDLDSSSFHLDENYHDLFYEWVTNNQQQEVA